MRLDELRLTAFGRFRDRTIGLGPGLNVIYGPNEAGKSTIQQFIAGMLYGFAKPGLKTRRLLPEYDWYRPWTGGGYRGTLLLTLDNGRQVRIERDFERHRAQVYDSVTGQELDFATDARSEPLFAQEWLRLSQPEFTSTVSIGQLMTSELDADAAGTLAARMAALQATGREDDSAARALERLDRWLRDDVGTQRARLSPLGGALADLADVRRQLESARRTRADNLQREAEQRRLQQELDQLRLAEAEAEEAIARAAAAEARMRLDRVAAQAEAARSHAEAAARLRAELRPLAPLAGLDPGEAERVPAYYEAWEQARAAEADAAGRVRRQEQELARLQQDLGRLAVPGSAAELEARADGLQADVDRLQARAAAVSAAGSGGAPASRAPLLGALAAVMAGTALALGVAVSPWLLVLLLPAAVLAAMALAAMAAGPGPGAAGDLAGLQRELAARSGELQALLQQCGCGSVGELKGRLRQAAALQAQVELAARTLEELRRPEPAGAPRGGAGALERLLAPLAAAAACSPYLARAVAEQAVTREDVATFTRLWRSYRDRAAELAEAEADLARAWVRADDEAAALAAGGYPWAPDLAAACTARDGAAAAAALAGARQALARSGGAVGGAAGGAGSGAAGGAAQGNGAGLAALQARRSELQQRLLAVTAALGKLQGQIEEAYADLPDVAELARRQAELEARVAELELRRRAMERARAAIAAVSEEMHRDFAPRLAARVGPIVAAVTGGRYREVRVSDRLELATEVPETGGLRPARDLSAGTLDQLYFALRLGAALELTAGAERPPIVCDDSLVQYDDDRALACLRYLADLAAEHQVLLLTCHRRELAAAQAVGAHVVELA